MHDISLVPNTQGNKRTKKLTCIEGVKASSCQTKVMLCSWHKKTQKNKKKNNRLVLLVNKIMLSPGVWRAPLDSWAPAHSFSNWSNVAKMFPWFKLLWQCLAKFKMWIQIKVYPYFSHSMVEAAVPHLKPCEVGRCRNSRSSSRKWQHLLRPKCPNFKISKFKVACSWHGPRLTISKSMWALIGSQEQHKGLENSLSSVPQYDVVLK